MTSTEGNIGMWMNEWMEGNTGIWMNKLIVEIFAYE